MFLRPTRADRIPICVCRCSKSSCWYDTRKSRSPTCTWSIISAVLLNKAKDLLENICPYLGNDCVCSPLPSTQDTLMILNPGKLSGIHLYTSCKCGFCTKSSITYPPWHSLCKQMSLVSLTSRPRFSSETQSRFMERPQIFRSTLYSGGGASPR